MSMRHKEIVRYEELIQWSTLVHKGGNQERINRRD